jgi:hypothetical protein
MSESEKSTLEILEERYKDLESVRDDLLAVLAYCRAGNLFDESTKKDFEQSLTTAIFRTTFEMGSTRLKIIEEKGKNPPSKQSLANQ